jgi:hypothetical protein
MSEKQNPVRDPLPDLPGYSLEYSWNLRDHFGLLVVMNVIGIVLIPIVFIGFALVAIQISPSQQLDFGFSGWDSALTCVGMLVAFLLMVLLHEGLHGLTMSFFGAKPQYGVEIRYGVAYATAPGHFFSRNQFIMVAIIPLLVITTLGLSLFYWELPGMVVSGLLFMLTLNLIGAVGDIWMIFVCLRYPKNAKVLDERYGIKIFVQDLVEG